MCDALSRSLSLGAIFVLVNEQPSQSSLSFHVRAKVRVTSPVPVKFLFPSIPRHVGRFKTKLCLSYPITKSIWKMSEQVKNTTYPFTCSANSETSGCNLSWEPACRIIEQVVIVFSRSEAPRVPCTLDQHRALLLSTQRTSFRKRFSTWLRVPRRKAPHVVAWSSSWNVSGGQWRHFLKGSEA